MAKLMDELKDECVNGHDLNNPDNVKEYKGKDGFWRRYCIPCNKIRQQKYRDKKRQQTKGRQLKDSPKKKARQQRYRNRKKAA